MSTAMSHRTHSQDRHSINSKDTSTVSDGPRTATLSRTHQATPTTAPKQQQQRQRLSQATPKSNTTAGSTIKKKKIKHSSPFRIKVGCVVALRYRSEGNHVQVVASKEDGSDEPKQCTSRMRLPTNVAEVWADPQPGRDENFALIGQRIRCGFPKSVLSIPNTTTRILEGEIVGLLTAPSTSTMDLRTLATSPTIVELLIDRTMLPSMPFLERMDNKNDHEMKTLSDVEKKRLRYEQTIRGRHKVVVKVHLAPISNVAPHIAECSTTSTDSGKSRDDVVVAKWAIRKRIALSCNDPADTTTTTTTPTKSAPAQTLYVGNKFDSNVQQERNWRWMAARHLDLRFSQVLQQEEDNGIQLLQTMPGLAGQVLSVHPVTSSAEDSNDKPKTLAHVTLQRLYLPEHTHCGRLPHHGKNEMFHDADNDGLRYIVPVEELIILQRKVSRKRMNNEQQHQLMSRQHHGGTTSALISHSYSLKKAVWLPLSSSSNDGSNNKIKNNGNEDGETLPSKSNNISRTVICHRCKTNVIVGDEGKNTKTTSTTKSIVLCNECLEKLRPFRKLQGTKQMDACDCGECMDKLRKRIGVSFRMAVEQSNKQNYYCSTENRSTIMNDICMVCCRACKTGVRCAQCNGAMHKHCYLWNKTLPVGGTGVVGASDRKRKLCRTCAAMSDEDLVNDGTIVSTVQRLVPTDFDLPAGFMAPDALPRPSVRVITAIRPRQHKAKSTATTMSGKKRSRQSKNVGKATEESAIHGRKTKMDTQHQQHQPPPLAEEISVFEPTCSRTLPYDHTRGRVQGVKKHRMSAPTSDVYVMPDLRRNHRPKDEDDAANGVSQNKSSTDRAARANQRRVMKGVAALRQHHQGGGGGGDLGISSGSASGSHSPTTIRSSTSFFELDAIAGRESNVLRFDRSGIHAWGVFADEPIAAGEMIVEYRGEIIGNAMAEKRQVEYERARGSDYMFRIDAHTVCDATKLGNVARFLNASCDPNCYTQIITIQGTKRIAIYAKKDIRVGDELCYDYKFSLEYDKEKRIPCHCGAKDCRGYMNWDKKLDGRKAR